MSCIGGKSATGTSADEEEVHSSTMDEPFCFLSPAISTQDRAMDQGITSTRPVFCRELEGSETP